MGRRCCITSCTSTSRLPEHHGVTYHSFPLDPATRAIWIKNTRIGSERQITKSVLVCSRHFRRADFQPQRSGKYLLKQRVFPTVFPWGKIDPSQVATDLEELNNSNGNTISGGEGISTNSVATTSDEDVTKATVEATVAQIMAETAELNAAAGIKSTKLDGDGEASGSGGGGQSKFERVTNFSPGVRLEAQDFDGVWHSARILEVDNDEQEVLLRFERTGKMKSAVVGTEEWIPMNSTRLRQKVSTRPVQVFELEEKCLARWSGPRKFPGTVKKILGNDTYEILFDDGYVKNVRAIHMNKFEANVAASGSAGSASSATSPTGGGGGFSPIANSTTVSVQPSTPLLAAVERDGSTTSKKRSSSGSRKDWPLLDLSKLDLSTLNLPEIPHDGEWTCHWVNDQPIGREGYLIVGEHRKPTVIVEDWRLPPGWVKHMYQRSNVLGKWDVILVTPSGKRFRSKSDLKAFLEEQGQVYNPDIYDFSIHRRRAKDINAYVYTSDYTPQQIPKPRSLESTPNMTTPTKSAAVLAPELTSATTSPQYMETPIATPIPPMELMTTTSTIPAPTSTPLVSPNKMLSASAIKTEIDSQVPTLLTQPEAGVAEAQVQSFEGGGPGFAFIGGLKVQIINNLFRCPEVGCSKNFRKENHLQIHVKHYHKGLAKLLGDCPKMLELAEKRTHPNAADIGTELQPKNQIPNQEFFAKLYQQDIQQSRARSGKGLSAHPPPADSSSMIISDIKLETEIKTEVPDPNTSALLNCTLESNTSTVTATEGSLFGGQTTAMVPDESPHILTTTTPKVSTPDSHNLTQLQTRRSRFLPNKRPGGSGARKSNRQRTTRRYLTAAQATSSRHMSHSTVPSTSTSTLEHGTFGVSDLEETRHSFNATPDTKMLINSRKRKTTNIPTTISTPPGSGMDSPFNADSGSSSFQQAAAGMTSAAASAATETADPQMQMQTQSQYIKENGDVIKIVRMREEEIINCLCGFGEEDGLMIQCELCLCWQHGVCNGIDKESDVPEKYVCFICRNPSRCRESMRYKHDQDWLYEGTLPTANYHSKNPELNKRFDFLRKSHTLTGNLVELKRFMHSLRVKINVANNRCHPKLYLWAKKWDDDRKDKKPNEEIKAEQLEGGGASPNKRLKSDTDIPPAPEPAAPLIPNIPQPEAAIDPAECQQRLLEHIKVQQDLVMDRLALIEAEVTELEKQDDLPDLKDADISVTKDALSTFLKELDIMNDIAKVNALENNKISKAQATY